MRKHIVRIVVWGLVAVGAVAVLYRYYATRKVNQLMVEVDALILDGETKENELGTQVNLYVSGIIPKEFPAERAKLQAWTATADDLFAKIIEDYRSVAAKFEESRNLSRSVLLPTKYRDLMSEAYRRRAEGAEARRKAVALLTDPSVPTAQELGKRRSDLMEAAYKTEREFKLLEEEAEKLSGGKKGNGA